MPYIPPEVVEKAREMDLLTYLKSYEPQELVHFGGNTYCTREHDSLKISNGKWCWFSRGIGGYSALDYLIKVKEMPFTQAVGSHMKNAGLVMLGRPTRQTKALESDKGVLSKLRGFLESCSKAFDRMERGADNLLSKTQSDKAMEEKPSVKLELRQMKAAKSEKSKAPMQQEAVR